MIQCPFCGDHRPMSWRHSCVTRYPLTPVTGGDEMNETTSGAGPGQKKTKYREPWFLSNDNDAETWCITDGVEAFPIADATQTEFGLAVKGTTERASRKVEAAPSSTPEDMAKAVRLWAARFIPGDRWDTEDMHDLEAALSGVVEAPPTAHDLRPVRVEVSEPDEVEWEYGVEDNVAEGGIDEGYSSGYMAQRVAAERTGRYTTPGIHAWAVKRVKAGPWIPVEKGTTDE